MARIRRYLTDAIPDAAEYRGNLTEADWEWLAAFNREESGFLRKSRAQRINRTAGERRAVHARNNARRRDALAAGLRNRDGSITAPQRRTRRTSPTARPTRPRASAPADPVEVLAALLDASNAEQKAKLRELFPRGGHRSAAWRDFRDFLNTREMLLGWRRLTRRDPFVRRTWKWVVARLAQDVRKKRR